MFMTDLEYFRLRLSLDPLRVLNNIVHFDM